MKDTTIVGLFMVFVGGLVVLSFVGMRDFKKNCELKGGVIVHTYAADNCWKDGQYISVE